MSASRNDQKERVLVALDGSPAAKTALPVARAIATQLHVQLTILHVAPTRIPLEILRQRLDPITSIALSLTYAFSVPFWGECAGVEIYTLNALLMGLTLLALGTEARWKWPVVIYAYQVGCLAIRSSSPKLTPRHHAWNLTS